MATISPSPADAAHSFSLHRFTSAEYMQMVEIGVLSSEDRVELIDGVVVEMSPAGSRHNHFLSILNRIFAPLWDKYEARIQGTLPITEEQVYDPDFMLLDLKPDGYKNQLPQPADVRLVIEAAESSLKRDQEAKLPVYAQAGIEEYWIADLKQEVLLVHRQPNGNRYQSVETLKKTQSVAPLAAPEFSIELIRAFD